MTWSAFVMRASPFLMCCLVFSMTVSRSMMCCLVFSMRASRSLMRASRSLMRALRSLMRASKFPISLSLFFWRSLRRYSKAAADASSVLFRFPNSSSMALSSCRRDSSGSPPSPRIMPSSSSRRDSSESAV
ncbi:hypothetical protein G9A89_000253, partial [Geosiphon pyriformis]